MSKMNCRDVESSCFFNCCLVAHIYYKRVEYHITLQLFKGIILLCDDDQIKGMDEHSDSIAIIHLSAWMLPCDIPCLVVMSH